MTAFVFLKEVSFPINRLPLHNWKSQL